MHREKLEGKERETNAVRKSDRETRQRQRERKKDRERKRQREKEGESLINNCAISIRLGAVLDYIPLALDNYRVKCKMEEGV